MTTDAVAPIQMEAVSKWYGDVIGVNQITLDLPAGVTGLLGPNGAGKSTLLKLITGQLRPGRGTLRVLGADPWSDREVFRRVGYCPDQENLYEDMSALEFVTLLGRFGGYDAREAERRAADRLDRVKLTDARHRRIRGFSKGMRQRTKLAAALLHDPEVLILDEPLNGLDPTGRMESLSLFRQLGAEGKTLLVSSHILHEIEGLTPKVVLLNRGRLLAQGTVEEIRSLIDNQPLTMKVETPNPRAVAQYLAGVESVVSIELPAPGAPRSAAHALVLRTTHPDSVCEALQTAALEGRLEIRSLVALDENLDAVFGYLTQ